MSDATKKDVLEAIRTHLEGRGIDGSIVVPEADLESDVGLDSLDTVELSLGLEQRFGVEIADEDLEGVRTVSDAVDVITGKVVARA